MSSIETSHDMAAGRGNLARFTALPLFALAIFVSAFLLFSVASVIEKAKGRFPVSDRWWG